MTVRRLAAVDAQTLWMSASIPSDQFLLYAFDGCAADLEQALNTIRARAGGEFGLRVEDGGFWTYPRWAPRAVGAEQIVVHELAEPQWQSCLDAVTALTDDPVDARDMTWRLHVFPRIEGIPGVDAGAVAVFQVAHAFADGVRASALAAYLLGRDVEVPGVTVPAVSAAALPWRSLRAARLHRRLLRDVAAGLVPPQADSRPALYSNNRPDGARHLRTVLCSRAQFADTTVTVGALAAMSEALAGHLRQLGDDPAQLGAEVPMAKTGPRSAYNHFGNVTVGLFPALAVSARNRAIAADLHARRRRAAHPALRAEADAFAAMPAPLLRWGVGQFDPDVRSPTVTGNTVVSSVNRGPKDLTFGGATVVLTAGFPSLSPMMGLTHGVHGIGDTIAVSVHAADSAIGDIDAYLDRLRHALSP
ncbi:WS/DGAT domain-containing protein [Mycobacterium sp. SMC-4]|uniref:WS/DGAT domain-containing protein n=1 Tax=Mycobacterium sp. SMC-4 TaxID=2857059 RepID=UPI003D066558